jgi:hypothetical protein
MMQPTLLNLCIMVGINNLFSAAATAAIQSRSSLRMRGEVKNDM